MWLLDFTFDQTIGIAAATGVVASVATSIIGFLGQWWEHRHDRGERVKQMTHDRGERSRQFDHERDAEMRGRMLDAAGGFLGMLDQAVFSLMGHSKTLAGLSDVERKALVRNELDQGLPLVREAGQRIAGIRLLFGSESAVTEAASRAAEDLSYLAIWAEKVYELWLAGCEKESIQASAQVAEWGDRLATRRNECVEGVRAAIGEPRPLAPVP